MKRQDDDSDIPYSINSVFVPDITILFCQQSVFYFPTTFRDHIYISEVCNTMSAFHNFFFQIIN